MCNLIRWADHLQNLKGIKEITKEINLCDEERNDIVIEINELIDNMIFVKQGSEVICRHL